MSNCRVLVLVWRQEMGKTCNKCVCVVSYSSGWLHAAQSVTSLARSIKIKRPHLFWHLEMKVMFCLCFPWKTCGMMVLWVICHCWQVFYAALSGAAEQHAFLTHARQRCDAQLVLGLLFGAKAFQAPSDETLWMRWPWKMVPGETGMGRRCVCGGLILFMLL